MKASEELRLVELTEKFQAIIKETHEEMTEKDYEEEMDHQRLMMKDEDEYTKEDLKTLKDYHESERFEDVERKILDDEFDEKETLRLKKLCEEVGCVGFTLGTSSHTFNPQDPTGGIVFEFIGPRRSIKVKEFYGNMEFRLEEWGKYFYSDEKGNATICSLNIGLAFFLGVGKFDISRLYEFIEEPNPYEEYHDGCPHGNLSMYE